MGVIEGLLQVIVPGYFSFFYIGIEGTFSN